MNRYGIEHYHDQGSEMIEYPNGDYVLYEDAAELQQRCLRVEAKYGFLLSVTVSTITDVTELQHRLETVREALLNIAGSYPKTDEGEILASMARDALKELLK